MVHFHLFVRYCTFSVPFNEHLTGYRWCFGCWAIRYCILLLELLELDLPILMDEINGGALVIDETEDALGANRPALDPSMLCKGFNEDN